ncbi:MAG TPA: VWA domain-containing protein, partial [Burkholderiaceae bacterium]|nr:VWA domain-containing protein [Burkholderiaceae bacterium]
VAPGTPVPPGTAGTTGTPGVPASEARVSEARVSEARASEAPTSAAHGDDVRAKPAPRAGSVPGQSPPPPRPPRSDLKAGLVDDNADFAGYLAFLERHAPALQRQRDVSERYRVLVTDARGRPVPDAELALSWPGAPAATLWARTDAAGTAWLHPRALLSPDAVDARHALQVLARGPDGSVARAALVRGQRARVLLQVGSVPVPPRTPLDLVFMVDATGSMGDEIAKLRASMQSIAERIARLPGRVDLCLGLVAYRDLGDEYVTRRYDLTGDLAAFQRVLGGLRASGGGDEPEALDEALHETVHGIGWRGAGTSRLVLMIGDAPPHLRADVPHYDQSATAALARGIKVHAVGASGLNRQGETTFRSIAQLTGGRFVFLTYEDAARPGRGPGTETPHDVRDYRVADLDELIVRLVREEVAARAGS